MRRLYEKCRNRVTELYSRYKDRDGVILIPLVALALFKIVGHYVWLLISGRGLPQCDDSRWYMNYAGSLLANLRDGLDINDTFYFGYNILLSLLLAVFKDPAVVILVQAVTASFSVILVYKIAKLLFNRATAVIASIFYVGTYDITLWSMYLLSDSFFLSLLLLCVYLLLMALETKKPLYRTLFVLSALYLLVFRPTGVIALAFILVYIAVRLDGQTVRNFLTAHRTAIGVVFAGVAVTGAYLYAGGHLEPLISSVQFNAKKVLYNIYAKGWIYDKPTPHDYFFRPDYSINVCNSLILSFIINNWDHVSIIYGKRAAAFLGRWVWDADVGSLKGILRLADSLIPLALFTVGTAAAVANRRFRKASVLWLVILAVFAFCVLVFIDWMYRYRLPAVPFIAIIAAYGAERIVHRALVVAKKYAGMTLDGQRKDTGCSSGL